MVYFQAEIPILEGHAVGIYEMAWWYNFGNSEMAQNIIVVYKGLAVIIWFLKFR
jgi:hypothetical protein